MPKDQLLILRGGMPPVRGKKLVYYADRAFRARLLPPPEPPKLSDSEAQGQKIQALALGLASLRDEVEDIRARVVERPMSEAQAAGEAPLSLDAISLTLSDADMEALPDEGASEAEVQHWLRRYAERASSASDEAASAVAVGDTRAAA